MADVRNEHPYMEIDPLNLRISPELVGASLAFKLEDHQLEFKLPSPANPETLAPKHKNDRGRVEVDSGLFAHSWQPQGDNLVPREVLVERAVLFFLESPELERYKKESGISCDELADKLKGVGKRAIQLWLRTLRWKSDDALNGRILTDYLTDSNERVSVPPLSGKPGCSSTQMFAFINIYENNVSEEVWREAEQSLRSGEEPPLAFDLFADAVYLAVQGDYRRAYLELAMAAEVHIRTRNEDELPDSLNSHVRKEIRSFSYSKHLDLFFKQLDKNGKDALTGQGGIKSKLTELLRDRNIIAHHGDHTRSVTTNETVTFSQEKFSVYSDAVKRLLKH